MPRLPPQLLRQAFFIDPLLPLLLRSCRDLQSARNELRWLREHISAARASSRHDPIRFRLHQLCLERSRGKPLQYIIGDQLFGNLEILCRPGVLIPRPETEIWTAHLAEHILSYTPLFSWTRDGPLRILDLCAGTGCISLLLHSLLYRSHPSLEILGIDISPTAISLARRNLQYNHSKNLLQPTAISQVHFQTGDIFKSEGVWQEGDGEWDIVVSNPPYISPAGFNHTTARSVRNWEPKTALVPLPAGSVTDKESYSDASIGDRFYPRILEIAAGVRAKVVAMEVGDMTQAQRVTDLVLQMKEWSGCEIWRDGVSERDRKHETQSIGDTDVIVRGEGNARAVITWK
ncbi:MAG: hypothetical protein Q9225_006328 [Loekoesia sp. 1 TL-2023]